MPELNGKDFLELSDPEADIIVVSSKKEYAFEAYSYNVTHFLLKPVKPVDLDAALKRVRNKKPEPAEEQDIKAKAGTIFIKVDGSLVRLNLSDIRYVETVGDYAFSHQIR